MLKYINELNFHHWINYINNKKGLTMLKQKSNPIIFANLVVNETKDIL